MKIQYVTDSRLKKTFVYIEAESDVEAESLHELFKTRLKALAMQFPLKDEKWSGVRMMIE
jgi:hypothetical protein